MKKKILGAVVGTSFLFVGVFSLSPGVAEAFYECSVSANCFQNNVVYGTVSCSGTTCDIAFQAVRCDGKITKCSGFLLPDPKK